MKFVKISCRRGFTLAELMAVVIIVSIFAGIALGSYRKSVDRAKFVEGQSLAHQVASARDTYYYDHVGLDSEGVIPNAFTDLDIDLSKSGTISQNVFKGKNFTVTMLKVGVQALHNDGEYGICVYQEAFGTQKNAADQCLGVTTAGQELCKSLGYTPVTACK